MLVNEGVNQNPIGSVNHEAGLASLKYAPESGAKA